MDYHHHARLTIYSREQLAKSVVEGRLSLRKAAAERGLSRQSASKWVRRYRALGLAGLVIAMVVFLAPGALGAFGLGFGAAIFIWAMPRKKKEEPE